MFAFRFRSGRVAILTAALLAALTLALATPSRAAVSVPEVGKAKENNSVKLPDGTVVKLPAPLEKLKPSDLAKYGIIPGKHGIKLATLKVLNKGAVSSSSLNSDAIPATALGHCSNSSSEKVCEDVYGSGRKITSWEVYTLFPWPDFNCTIGVFFEPANVVYYETNEDCGTNAIFEGTSKYLPHTFGNHSQACVSFIGLVGKPCVNVYS